MAFAKSSHFSHQSVTNASKSSRLRGTSFTPNVLTPINIILNSFLCLAVGDSCPK